MTTTTTMVAWVVMMFNAHYLTVIQDGKTQYVDREACEQVALMRAAPDRVVPHKWFCARVVVPNIVVAK